MENFGDWKEKVLIKLERGEWVVLAIGYREGEYWDISDKIHSVLDWNRDVKENWIRNTRLDEYVWKIIVPRDAGEEAFRKLKDMGVDIILEVGEHAVTSWLSWVMYIGHVASDVGKTNDYTNPALAE